MDLETLKITELGLEFYVLEKVPPQMGKSRERASMCLRKCPRKWERARKSPIFYIYMLILLASQARFELATCPLGGGRAIQLRHWDEWPDFIGICGKTQVYMLT